MFKCRDCEKKFLTPQVHRESHGFYDGLYEEFHSCPFCGGDYDELIYCELCGDEFTNECDILSLPYCEECKEDLREKFQSVVGNNFTAFEQKALRILLDTDWLEDKT